ncbi:MAG: AraC family transcriptional regulator [Ruminococcaceae bacterium]|nr:AraC family transcriptional regulator [Oscillospiraceae bacterium]
MGLYAPVNYDGTDGYHVRSFGIEEHSALAHWGPGRRGSAILHYVLSGSGWFNGRPVEAGQGFFIDAGQYHEYHSSDERPWKYFWLMFSADLAKKYAKPLAADGDGIFFCDITPELPRLREGIFASRQPLGHHEALSWFFRLMSLHTDSRREPGSAPLLHIRNAKAFIESNLGRRITVADVAEAIHINERYLYNLFVEHEHTTPKAVIDAQKIRMAETLLTCSALTVSEVAQAVGFADSCAFSRFFTRHTGMPPTIFRRDKR